MGTRMFGQLNDKINKQVIDKTVNLDFSSGNQVIQENGKLFNKVTVNKSTDFTAENIRSGKTLGNIQGTASTYENGATANDIKVGKKALVNGVDIDGAVEVNTTIEVPITTNGTHTIEVANKICEEDITVNVNVPGVTVNENIVNKVCGDKCTNEVEIESGKFVTFNDNYTYKIEDETSPEFVPHKCMNSIKINDIYTVVLRTKDVIYTRYSTTGYRGFPVLTLLKFENGKFKVVDNLLIEASTNIYNPAYGGSNYYINIAYRQNWFMKDDVTNELYFMFVPPTDGNKTTHIYRFSITGDSITSTKLGTFTPYPTSYTYSSMGAPEPLYIKNGHLYIFGSGRTNSSSSSGYTAIVDYTLNESTITLNRTTNFKSCDYYNAIPYPYRHNGNILLVEGYSSNSKLNYNYISYNEETGVITTLDSGVFTSSSANFSGYKCFNGRIFKVNDDNNANTFLFFTSGYSNSYYSRIIKFIIDDDTNKLTATNLTNLYNTSMENYNIVQFGNTFKIYHSILTTTDYEWKEFDKVSQSSNFRRNYIKVVYDSATGTVSQIIETETSTSSTATTYQVGNPITGTLITINNKHYLISGGETCYDYYTNNNLKFKLICECVDEDDNYVYSYSDKLDGLVASNNVTYNFGDIVPVAIPTTNEE